MSPRSVSKLATPQAMAFAFSVALALGAQIRAERIRRRWTLDDLAGKSAVSPSTIHGIEAGAPGSILTYARLASALGLQPEFALTDARRRRGPLRDEDPVHAAMGEIEARHLGQFAYPIGLDEPFQRYQFAGRADLVSWDIEHRALLHIENRTRFPNIQESFGSFNAKRTYLGPALAQRLGFREWASETHVTVALWSADVLHTLRLRRASFRAVCPDPTESFAGWWCGKAPTSGRATVLVVLDPIESGRSDRRRMIGLDDVGVAKPRYRDYADALGALRRAGLA